MATAAVIANCTPPQPLVEHANESTNWNIHLSLGERVVWTFKNNDEHGVVRWVGYLPGHGELLAGVECDNPVGAGTGRFHDRVLFEAKRKHAMFIPVSGLIREQDSPASPGTSRKGDDWIDDIDDEEFEEDEAEADADSAPLTLNERVVWISDEGCEHGTVRWIGLLPQTGSDLMIGVELDNPKGTNDGVWGSERHFSTEPNHGLFIPAMGLIKEKFMGDAPRNGTAEKTAVRSQTAVPEEHSDEFLTPDESDILNDSFYDNINYGSSSAEPRNMNIEPRKKRPRAKLEPRKRASLGPVPKNEPNSVEINKLLQQLELAICQGHCDQASRLARRLAMFKISCSVIRKKPKLEVDSEDEIYLNVFVEDKVSHIGPFRVYVKPETTVQELKKMFQSQFDFPTKIQRWILGKQLAAEDDAALSSFGINSSGCPVFLYLMLSEYDEIEAYREKVTSYLHALDVLEDEYLEENDRRADVEKPTMKPNVPDSRDEPLASASPQIAQRRKVKTPEPEPIGWKCASCTCINVPTRPGCIACSASRPDDYVVPSDYEIPDDEKVRMMMEKQLEIEMQMAMERERQVNYQRFLETEQQDIILNGDVFECPVCLDDIQAGEGVRLRDCLHTFCRKCLADTVTHNETAEAKCPYMDNNYSCQSVLQDREIRQIVSPEIYDRHLQRSVATAESQAENSFHCKSADCRGWCIYEDDINEFLCPVCRHMNCLTCQAIHENLNCRQFQDRLELNAASSGDAKKTKEYLDSMLTRGEAMRCPKCQIILMKKWGCDWLKCSMCQTEICWVTRGPRWGPNGPGDTSGGCRCGIGGKRCHQRCQYCH